jgi:hypothetical protein
MESCCKQEKAGSGADVLLGGIAAARSSDHNVAIQSLLTMNRA